MKKFFSEKRRKFLNIIQTRLWALQVRNLTFKTRRVGPREEILEHSTFDETTGNPNPQDGPYEKFFSS